MALSPSPILSIAFNADRTQIAFTDKKDVLVYRIKGENAAQWERLHKLSEHDQRVLSVHWGERTNRLLTCSEDRTAYVWAYTGTEWKPTLVHLGANVSRGVLHCQWSPTESKFAVATGSQVACVCYFEPEHDWWVSKAIKGHYSTVTNVAWNPANNNILATCSTDQHVRIFLAWVKPVDGGENPGKFGTLLSEFPCNGWVTSCGWNSDGSLLAYTARDCTVGIISVADGAHQIIKTKFLPFRSLKFLGPDTFAVGCDDCNVYLSTNAGGTWSFKKLHEPEAKKEEASAISAARQKFQNEATLGRAAAVDKLASKHQNAVSAIAVLQDGPEWKIASASADGFLHLWDTRHA
eukprot:TRINITY_DN1946_c0_g1_i1.p1 TRINITY_DN1946_c0_g1~~TRINITY_DN1946_c0_g1_i1.p1  ORF type:complete len:350 (+),score=54.64 TRINITY_DN1946_c0_g1_i1:1059-2108(+)